MKATELLEKQHQKVRSLFKKLESGRSNNKKALREELVTNLVGHMAIEQELFYPAVRQIDEERVMESFEEHSIAELEMKRMLMLDLDDDKFMTRLTALKELIEHHLEEEEEGLFPKVEKKMKGDQLEQLGKRMEMRFRQMIEMDPQSLLPKGFETTSADIAQNGRRAPLSTAPRLQARRGTTPRGSDRSTSRGKGTRRHAGKASSRSRSARA